MGRRARRTRSSRRGRRLTARTGAGAGLLESSSGDAPPHTELRLDFADGGHLAFVNQRKFGTISWVDDVDEYVAAGELGPDPLADDVDLPAFLQRLEGRRAATAISNGRRSPTGRPTCAPAITSASADMVQTRHRPGPMSGEASRSRALKWSGWGRFELPASCSQVWKWGCFGE